MTLLAEREVKFYQSTASRIRRNILVMISKGGSGHPGGSLSLVDIMVFLYFGRIRHQPQFPRWEERDRVILSKGHAAPALYSVLAESGYFPFDELENFRKMGSPLQGHPDRNKVPGVEMSTGSLGQGLSVGVGMALGILKKNMKSKVYVLLGDGEIQEGQVWEAAMAGAHYKLHNLVAIIDNNNLQIDGTVDKVMNIYPLKEKWEAFGWKVYEINGHEFQEMAEVFHNIDTEPRQGPVCIIAHTIKGKGVSFMENRVEYHHCSNLSLKELERALSELC